jgi:hypothetical protein
MTSNADEIQQIIKSDRAMKTTRFQLKLLIAMFLKKKMKKYSYYEDEYAGAIKFLKSPM